jgi:hypothetical protein
VRPPYIGTVRLPYIGTVRPPYIGTARPPYIGTARQPYIGTVRLPYIGTARQPYIDTARPPFIGMARLPYIGTARPPYIGTVRLYNSNAAFDGQIDASLGDFSKCCFRPPLAEPGVSSLLQPAAALRCQCGPAHWHSTISKTIVCLTSQKHSHET